MSSESYIKETYDYLLEASKGALNTEHSFAPFGAGITAAGERTHVHIDPEMNVPTAQDYIAMIVAAFQRDSLERDLRCAGLAFDGQVRLASGDAAPAVCMHIEVRGGESLEAFVPYVREAPGRVTFFDPIFAPTDSEIFHNR
jgi:hypothetical protein